MTSHLEGLVYAESKPGRPHQPTIRPRFRAIMALAAVLSLLDTTHGDATPSSARPLSTASADAAILAPAQAAAAETDYERHCATCHNNPAGRMPSRGIIASMPPKYIYQVITRGPMQAQASALSDVARNRLAIYLGQKSTAARSEPAADANRCTGPQAVANAKGAPDWPGWGRDAGNTRHQPSPGFDVSEIPRLKLKWAFAYPGGVASTNPIVAAGRVYVGSLTGQVFALDARTGCTVWTINVGAPIRAAVSVGPNTAAPQTARIVAYISDYNGTVHAVDARDGRALWATSVIADPKLSRISGSPTLYAGRLYVPITGREDSLAANPDYQCCRSRGALVALDAAKGDVLWTHYTIANRARPTIHNSRGVQMFGPAGAGIWSAPTVDPMRHAVYVSTGNDYSFPGSDASDAIIALDWASGAELWKTQVLKKDIWVLGCEGAPPVNCLPNHGPDLDFASPPILAALSAGRQVILAGAKSGNVYAFDPDRSGRILWTVGLAKGDSLGAILFGSAADDSTLYVALSNAGASALRLNPGGLVALDIGTGVRRWTAQPVPASCSWGKQACLSAQAAPIFVMNGAVFSGAADGHIRAYGTANGALLWDFDTGKTYRAVNGVDARGGGIGRGGATAAEGTLFVNTGDGYGRAGNALLALTVDGR